MISRTRAGLDESTNVFLVGQASGAGGLTDAELRASPVPVTLSGATTGSDYHKVALGSNNADTIKASAGVVYGVKAFNNADYPVYIKLFNKASAPNPAADTVIRTIGVQAGMRVDDVIAGLAFATGIAIAIVKGIADNDNTAVVAADVVVDVDYV